MGRFAVTHVLLVRRVAWKHRLVQAPGPGVTVVSLTFLVLAQGGIMQEPLGGGGAGAGGNTPMAHPKLCDGVPNCAVHLAEKGVGRDKGHAEKG